MVKIIEEHEKCNVSMFRDPKVGSMGCKFQIQKSGLSVQIQMEWRIQCQAEYATLIGCLNLIVKMYYVSRDWRHRFSFKSM